MKAIYFSHDTNSFYDPKIRIIVGKYGIWSYAVFWIILEMMATQREYKIPFNGFAEGIHPLLQSKKVIYDSDGGIGFFKDESGKEITDEEVGRFSICLATIKDLLQDMINVCLFKLSGDNFLYSESLLERMRHKDEVSSKRIESGRLGGLANAKQAPKQMLSSKVKESKVKKSKEKSLIHTTEVLSRFEQLWNQYPNKDGMKMAKRHFEASVLTDQDWQEINTALENYLQSDNVLRGFIKNGSTWFNNWRDWIVPPVEKQRLTGAQVDNLKSLNKFMKEKDNDKRDFPTGICSPDISVPGDKV
jgi:hypothetical protein